MKRKIKDYFRYFLYRIFQFIFLVMPRFITKNILVLIAKLAYRFNQEHIHIAKINLDLVYGDKLSNEEKNKIIYDSYLSLFYNMYEFVENQSISKEELLNKAKLENEEVILNALKTDVKSYLLQRIMEDGN